MDNKKFEQLIDLIINENDEQARALFHDIVVEKSREIYESMMDEGMDGQVGDLMDEIGHEEEGMSEEDDEFADIEMDDDEEGLAHDEESEEDEIEDLEDRVVDIEDKLDMLMAEFEEIMGHDEGEEDFGDEEMGGEEDFGDEEDMMEAADDEDDEEDEEDVTEALEEAIQLKQVPGLYGSKIGGDDGSNTKSTALTGGPKVKAPNVNPVNFSGSPESVPTGPKAPGNYGSKGETTVKHSGEWKNAPSQTGQKLDKAPAAHKAQATGVNTKSPVAESKVAKKRTK
jgi:hypothetical protein